MKKLRVLALVVLFTAALAGCAAKSAQPEDTARKFIDTYYAQYAQKEEIEKIWEDFSSTPSNAQVPYSESDPVYKEMNEYIDAAYEKMVSVKGRSSLVANRILFNPQVIDSTALKCEVTSVTLKEKSNEVNGLTYGFIGMVTETNPDQTKSKKEVPGEIRMLDEVGKWLVDGFKLGS